MATAYPSMQQPAGYPTAKYHPGFFESLATRLVEGKDARLTRTHGIKSRYISSFFKAMTALYIVSLMNHYRNWSLGSCLYLGLHGVYGLIGFLKDFGLPDRDYDKRIGIFGAIMKLAMLSATWIIPWLQISGHGIDKPSSERVMACVMLFALGLAIMISANAQKTFSLHNRPGLLANGMYKYTRNPSYLGQMMIHSAFAFATGSIVAWWVVLGLWGVFFLPKMISKDISLRNMAGAHEYFAQSSMLLPKFFFRNTLLHYASWAAIIGVIWGLGGMVSLSHFLKGINPLHHIFGHSHHHRHHSFWH